MSGEVVVRDSIAPHVRRVAAAAGEREPRLREPVLRWADGFREQVPELEPTQWASVVDLATVVSVISAYGASWHLM